MAMNPFYLAVRTFFLPILRIWNRLGVVGAENVPGQGPCIVAANHASYLDAFVLGAACPRKIHFLVVRDHFRKWFARWFYWGMDALPVNQDGWDGDAVKAALRILERGEIIGIFPEGTRSPDGALGEMKAGVALLAKRSGCPVLPAALVGTARSFPRGAFFPLPTRVTVVFGEPFRLDAGPRERLDRQTMSAFLERLRRAIVDLHDGARGGRSRQAPDPEEAPR